MTDGSPIPPASRSARTVMAFVAMAFCFAVIALLLWSGSDRNTLHTSALAWSFALVGAVILGTLGFGALDSWLDRRGPGS